jgi:hypothetical protein
VTHGDLSTAAAASEKSVADRTRVASADVELFVPKNDYP